MIQAITAFLKKNLILFIAIGLIIFMYLEIKNLHAKLDRVSNNQYIYAKGLLSVQKNLTKREFKDYYPDFKILLEGYQIKQSLVEHYIKTSYNFIDSPIVSHYTKVDSFPDVRYFTVYDNCYELSGISYPDSVVTQALRHDTINTFLFKYAPKKRFFLIRPLYKLFDSDYYSHKAISISSCNNDTISVIDNVKIVK